MHYRLFHLYNMTECYTSLCTILHIAHVVMCQLNFDFSCVTLWLKEWIKDECMNKRDVISLFSFSSKQKRILSLPEMSYSQGLDKNLQ
jgi:hypothetical protein